MFCFFFFYNNMLFFLGSIADLGLNKDVTALLNECEQPGLVQTLLLPEDLALRHLPALSVAHRRLDFTSQRPPLTPLDEVSITLTSLCASCAHKEFVWHLQCFTIFFLSLINNSKIVRNNWFNDSFVSSSVVKRPVLRYQVGTKKNANITVPGLLKYRWYRGPGQPRSWSVGPYDFRDAENADGIAEPSLKAEFTV